MKGIKPKKKRNGYWKSIENQRQFMDSLYQKLQLKSRFDWKNVENRTIIKNGGTSIICSYHSFLSIFQTIYPEHDWSFLTEKRKYRKFWSSLSSQREFMDYLYRKFNLSCLEDWKKVKPTTIAKNGGNGLVALYDNYKLLLKEVYPHYPWLFPSINKTKSFLTSQSNQLQIMEAVYKKYHFVSLKEWQNISLFLSRSSLNNSIYPSHINNDNNNINNDNNNNNENNSFFQIDKGKEYERQRSEEVFSYIELTDEEKRWKKIISEEEVGKLLHFYPSLSTLLFELYPTFDWHFAEEVKPILDWRSIEYQRSFMLHLKDRLNFSSIGDFRKFSKRDLMKMGAGFIAHLYENYSSLLSSIFPDHPWDLNLIKPSRKSNLYWKSIDNQFTFMINLFHSLTFQRLEEFQSLNSNLFKLMGGGWLYHFYGDFFALLCGVFPNYPWNLHEKTNSFPFWQRFENQRKFLTLLFAKLNLISDQDKNSITMAIIKKHGGEKLLELYHYNLFLLLSYVYPGVLWNGIRKRHGDLSPSLHLKQKIMELKRRFMVREKKDWFRVRVQQNKVPNLRLLLKQIYPLVTWPKREFNSAKKMSTQRLLFIHLTHLFPQYLLLENVRNWSTSQMEIDIFIPSLNLGFEYQGEQHYDEVVALGYAVNHIISRDRLKTVCCNDMKINLLQIPFWWDKTVETLFSSIFPSDLHI